MGTVGSEIRRGETKVQYTSLMSRGFSSLGGRRTGRGFGFLAGKIDGGGGVDDDRRGLKALQVGSGGGHGNNDGERLGTATSSRFLKRSVRWRRRRKAGTVDQWEGE